MISSRALAFLAALLCASSVLAQTATGVCGVPPVAAADAQPNIFTEQQEEWLGDAMAESLEAEVRPVRDVALNQHLQAIADRLAEHLPPTRLKFRVQLMDESEVNGLSIAGGRIYITRKLAAVAQNDDELAGVIGHEMGHIASHQYAFELTRDFKRLLGVTTVGDRADVFTKYQALLDAMMKDKHPPAEKEDNDQQEADKIGVYVGAAAGYRPAAFGEIWDRVFFVQGKTKGRVSDFFQITKPDQKRLRQIRALVAALPAGCGNTLTADQQAFAVWHDAVVANQKGSSGELSASLSEVKLTPPLRLELEQLRFSPDGKLAMAQDESSIFVLTSDPLAVRYRIDARDALPAYFSPDSQSLTFATPGLHTEQWSTQDHKLIAAHELLTKKECYNPKLSPDGRTLVCVEITVDDGLPWLGLAMIDTATSQVLWEEKHWSDASYALYWNLIVAREEGLAVDNLYTAYSPDNNVLIAGMFSKKRILDLRTRTLVKPGYGIETLDGWYTFLGNDRIAGVTSGKGARYTATVYSFPEGKTLHTSPLPVISGIDSVSDPGSHNQMVVHGLRDYESLLADLDTGKVVMALKAHAIDEHGGAIIGEVGTGAIALTRPGLEAKDQQHAVLPFSPLAGLRGVGLSADGKYLAMSSRTRGGVWDVSTGKQMMLVVGFRDASWGKDDSLYIDVPRKGLEARHVAQVSMQDHAVKTLPYTVDDETHMRYGRLTDWKQDDKKKTWTLSLHDPATNNVLWSRNFPDKFFQYTASLGDRDLIFGFELKTNTAKDAIKASPTLAGELAQVKDRSAGRLIQVVDGKTGADAGSLVVELPPNYAGIDGINRAGDLLYVQGVDDRTAVYSMESGKKLRQLFGYVIALDPDTGRVFTANRVGEAVVYDKEGKELARYQMGDPIRFAVFRDGAKQVLVLTADERVRTMAVAAATAAAH
jgi:WD40 repeat protein